MSSPTTTTTTGKTIPANLPPQASRDRLLLLLNRQISYQTCLIIFLVLGTIAFLTPFKEYYLGNYATDPFDEVRDEIVARKLNQMGVIISGDHYFDTFNRNLIPLIDSASQEKLNHTTAETLTLTDFLVRANVRRDDLLEGLPADMLSQPVNLMVDGLVPLCGSGTNSSWETKAQLLFGNYFPAIRHEFCRDFHVKFPHDRFFNHDTKAPVDLNLVDVGNVSLGLIAVVNMSEVYLRHFNDAVVVRKIMKNVQEGFMNLELSGYTDDVAEAIVDRYSKGISLAEVVAMLPSSFNVDHVALVDVLGIKFVLEYYLESQELTMGTNVNGEAAISAEVTHAAATFFTSDFLATTVGMSYLSTTHLALFWECSIEYTSMAKSIVADDVDASVMKQCGRDLASNLPTFVVNLMFLFQPKERDYTTLDNTTTYTLGRRRESDSDYQALEVPEILSNSALMTIDGSSWSKKKTNTSSSTTLSTTPYGYLYTPDCKRLVTQALTQSGRNVQKYQAYMGDGLGNCAFRDSQETDLQTLCRLFMTSDEVLFSDLNGNLTEIPACSSLVDASASEAEQQLEQENLRQIEWFMIDTTTLTRRIRIIDNTSRQIRTFLLMLNFIGASHYALQYIYILKSIWIFISNSVLQPGLEERSRLASTGSMHFKPSPLVRLGILELLLCDPADGALEHPLTMVLMYLGAIGSLSNIFRPGCTAELSSSGGGIVIHCKPAIPVTSVNLLLTTLSSSYWVIRVTLQSRSLAMRLDHVVRDNFIRFWFTNACAVVVIHFTCKGITDVVFQNVELRSDPHIYAIIGGLCLALAISTGFILVHLAGTDSERLKALVKHESTRSLWKAAKARAISYRAFVAKWSTNDLDSVLCHCASPQIARQLQISSLPEQPEFRAWKLGNRSGDPMKNGNQPTIRINEFVAVHCAGGAHLHLQNVKWYLKSDGRGGVMAVDQTRSPRKHKAILKVPPNNLPIPKTMKSHIEHASLFFWLSLLE
ncbi:Transmembrane protein [Phytophthora palmivora]|uniref:Transmembrane protein n=1 Tax=Phytophthora palmivora TaxID=4796 RepID=A0A2P4YTB0_9STRA|nr:Transmembrane protein [Phytophthora palmivora]